jgi:putative spermidine/putrescine transport system ATP-binding protein
VRAARYLGAGTRVAVEVDGGELSLVVPGGPVPEPGAQVGLAWDPGALHPLEDA